MAVFSGYDASGGVITLPAPPLTTSNLTGAMFGLPTIGGGALACAGDQAGPLTTDVVGFVNRLEYSGARYGVHGDELFEKIIVTPRSKRLGFVLSNISWQTSVWNTHRERLLQMTAIAVTGNGNVGIDNPYGLPLIFGPGQVRNFTTFVPAQGDLTIKAAIVFVFPGEDGTDEGGAGISIMGTRIAIFPFDPDWSDGIRERTEYLTHILTAYARAEQRYALRKHPRTRLKYKLLTLTAQETATLEALLWNWQARMFGVPLWLDAQPLKANATAGDSIIEVDTTYRRFVAGGLCMIWRDAMTNEAVSVFSVSAGSVTLTAPLNDDWAADGRSWVVPMLAGRLADAVELDRLNALTASGEFEFACEVTPLGVLF